jgi:hypothetical protein
MMTIKALPGGDQEVILCRASPQGGRLQRPLAQSVVLIQPLGTMSDSQSWLLFVGENHAPQMFYNINI